MARKGNISDLAKVFIDYLQGRASSVKLINNTIDFFFENRKEVDIPLHFINEAILHKNPSLFVRNVIKYELFQTKSLNSQTTK